MYGERLRFLRKNAGLSQADLAEMTGVSRPNVSFWENSEYPPLEAIEKVCRSLGMETWEFFIDEQYLTRKYGIQGGFGDLLREIAGFDGETREQLRALFSMMIRVVAAKDAECVKPGSGQGDDGQVTGPAIPEPDEHSDGQRMNSLAMNRFPLAVEDYMQRFIWLTSSRPGGGRVQ